MRPFLAVCSLPCVLFVAALDARAQANAPLPAGLSLEGKPVAHLHHSDKAGAHVVVVTVTDVKEGRVAPDADPSSSQTLFGQQFSKNAQGAWVLDWRIKDFVVDCAFDLTLELVPGSLAVSDVDQNGEHETRFAYRLGCSSDVSPQDQKLMMHAGKQKFVVRGSTRVQVGEEDGRAVYLGGERTLDPAFDKAPKGLRELAVAEWARLLAAN